MEKKRQPLFQLQAVLLHTSMVFAFYGYVMTSITCTVYKQQI